MTQLASDQLLASFPLSGAQTRLLVARALLEWGSFSNSNPHINEFAFSE